MGIFPWRLMLLLLLLMADLSFAEEHAHRHAHEAATTSAPPPARTRRNQQRLQQLQQAQDGNDIVFDNIGNNNENSNIYHHQQHHHLRHEQHLRAELAGGNSNTNSNSNNRQPPMMMVVKEPTQFELEQLAMLPGPGQQHHLRHHNRHHAAWEQRVFRHQQQQQQHRLPAAATSTLPATTTTTGMPATFTSPTTSPSISMVTEGPVPLGNSSRYFDRDGIYASWMQPRSTLAPNWQQLEDNYEDEEDDEDDDDDDEDYADDVDEAAAAELAKQMPRYSLFSQKLPSISSNEQDYDNYDQLDMESTVKNNNNKHPSVSSGHAKGATKRNVFDWLFKRDKERAQINSQSHVKVETTTEKPKSFLDDSLAEEDNNEDPAFSNEQWNKIEHEHHLKQQKHQKELQALREKNRNSPLIRNGLRRGDIDNEDADNSFSHNYIPGKLTDLKNNQLGTVESVIKTRRKHGPSHAEVTAYWKKVVKESTCRVPQLRCVRAGSERDTSKQYAPHCIQLHRCAEDSGCCHSRHEICAPKEIHKVELPFFVLGTNNRKSETVHLTFDNHTECHCIERINYEAEVAKQLEMTKAAEIKQVNILNCKCPQLFDKIFQDDGTCRCDCSSSNYHCEFRKRGKEHFFMDERRCINQGICKPPTCSYGPYIKKEGRCPNQHEQLPYQSSYKFHNMS